MKIGDIVTYYTHEGSNTNHTSNDCAAIVTRVISDQEVDLVIFPPGGPITFERVRAFDEKNPGNQAGLSYWRAPGSAPPNFAASLGYLESPKWAAFQAGQAQELANAPAYKVAEVKDRQAKDLVEFRKANATKEPVK